jgi:hypothetical protein
LILDASYRCCVLLRNVAGLYVHFFAPPKEDINCPPLAGVGGGICCKWRCFFGFLLQVEGISLIFNAGEGVVCCGLLRNVAGLYVLSLLLQRKNERKEPPKKTPGFFGVAYY